MVTVMFPTVLETRDAAASGNLRAIEDLPGIEAQAARREITMATMLKSPSQLPELPDSPLVIHWDSETVEGEEWQVLRHGDTEIWREAALYESIEIFEDVVRVLQARYGSRFAELRPTEASLLWLYGDRLPAGAPAEGHLRVRSNGGESQVTVKLRPAAVGAAPAEARPPAWAASVLLLLAVAGGVWLVSQLAGRWDLPADFDVAAWARGGKGWLMLPLASLILTMAAMLGSVLVLGAVEHDVPQFVTQRLDLGCSVHVGPYRYLPSQVVRDAIRATDGGRIRHQFEGEPACFDLGGQPIPQSVGCLSPEQGRHRPGRDWFALGLGDVPDVRRA